jgi:hypothetical protein
MAGRPHRPPWSSALAAAGLHRRGAGGPGGRLHRAAGGADHGGSHPTAVWTRRRVRADLRVQRVRRPGRRLARKEDNRYRIADGDTAVTFQSCPPAQTPLGADGTQFNGGFLVAGPRCATLEVSTPQWRAPRRVTVSFGAGRCRA